ncbi:hypothetical protein, partial [Burkholderia stabilis]
MDGRHAEIAGQQAGGWPALACAVRRASGAIITSPRISYYDMQRYQPPPVRNPGVTARVPPMP